MHPTDADFLRTIYANRDNDAPRLVYADWLEERGDPYAEFIRVQVELAQVQVTDSRKAELLARERELLDLHEQEWRARYPTVPGMAWGPFVRGFPQTMNVALLGEFCPQSLAGAYTEFNRRLMDIEENHSHFLRPLLEALIARGGNHLSYLSTALDYVPECDCPALIDRAVEALAENPESYTAELIATSAVMQFPKMLHKHLDAIFTRRILAQTYYGTWFWRESGQKHFPFLRRVVEDVGGYAALRAWEAMLRTRDEAVLSYALGHARQVYARSQTDQSFERWLAWQLAEVGLVQENGKLRLLESPRVWHLMLPPEFYSGHFKHHPTRRAPSPDKCLAPMPFGGSDSERCFYCKERLHHIVTLDPVPDGIGVIGFPRLTIAVCLSCQLYEGNPPIFYEHDAKGRPRSFDTGEARDPAQSLFAPLKPCQVYLADLGHRWFWQSCHEPPQNIHRIGGPPSWERSPAYGSGLPESSPGYPSCPRCNRAMNFLMQLGSGIPFETGEGTFAWSGEGTGYCFWCNACRVSCWVSQCTY